MNARRGLGAGRAAAVSLAVAVMAFAPALAHACAVCGGGNPANRFAFFASTIVLSLIPLGLFVLAFLWLRSRIVRLAHDEFREREVNPRETGPERVG